jgi:dTDP-4-dehydrorhamnose 3,5-epimerase-like enzyme
LTQPNEVRGNHVHERAVEMTTVVGPCLVRLREADGIRDVEVPPGETWRFTIPPGVAHAYRNIGDTVMVLISFSTQVHDPAGSATTREQIL